MKARRNGRRDSMVAMRKRDEHVTEGYHCWCGPMFYQICPECDGSGEMQSRKGTTQCWYCRGEYHPGLLLAAPYTDEGPFIIVHNQGGPLSVAS